MGDPRKCKKKWIGPRHPWRKDRLVEEMRLIGEYGLRNKREIWIAQTMIRELRHKARVLLALPLEAREKVEKALLERVYGIGLLPENATLDQVLSLTVEDLLKRRLQTIVYLKGLAKSIYQARQLIVHGHIAIGGRRITSPGYIVKRDEEDLVDYYPNSPYRVVQQTTAQKK
ncbi:MAG: 30S ribosomal protein S4 [Sulfolobales archaeon]|nr:30S ribosomal protein S4 [Sulfolobales archaeon]MCX8199602.1 30S ribosomal protein S4 [Sulfolobales archaeon]MDW8170555.1 30S ribosomal protein S4 [Desulfurococcaceae archaeon]